MMHVYLIWMKDSRRDLHFDLWYDHTYHQASKSLKYAASVSQFVICRFNETASCSVIYDLDVAYHF